MSAEYKKSRSYQTLRHWSKILRDAEYRKRDRVARADFRSFYSRDGGRGLRHDLRPSAGGSLKTALIVSQAYLPFARLEAFMMRALQLAGFNIVMVGNRQYDYLRYGWIGGASASYELEDFSNEVKTDWFDQNVAGLTNLQEWLRLEYHGVHVGRITIATTLRMLKVGQLDFADPEVISVLRTVLGASVRHSIGALGLLEKLRPNAVLMMDRGYARFGELFDLAIERNIDVITWHPGHKSDLLVVKRYKKSNAREHPLSPSADSWERLCQIPWSSACGDQVRQTLLQSYAAQDWYSVVGTQFGKQILETEATLQKLGLVANRKVAVVFPHILWDGSFFYGEDLFDDYTEWFVETIRAACANSRLQWVVKLHPAHLVKSKQNASTEQPAELSVIRREFGDLPTHVKLILPETSLSTFSLFQIADYVVTVRGTVGIESAIFGIPVLTAGTGRYDRRGFTLDSACREEYLDKLAKLETYPRLSRQQVELAERYAYGAFACRPLRLSSVSLNFARDAIATPKLTVHCQTRKQWMAAEDMRHLAPWLADGTVEDLLIVPDAPDLSEGSEMDQR